MFGFGNKNLLKIDHEPGKDFDVTPLHGKYATFDMLGQDTGYARVGIISSGKNYIKFQFRGKIGMAYKPYIKSIQEVKMSEKALAKEGEIIVEEFDEDIDPFCFFVGYKCDIHTHQTRLFEATPGFFAAKVLYTDTQNGLIRIKENSKQFNIKHSVICTIMQVGD